MSFTIFNAMTLYIKNMVCQRCIMAVRSILDELGIRFTSIRLGEVDLHDEPSGQVMQELSARLTGIGFELIDDRKGRIIEKIKNAVIELVHHSSDTPKTNLSDHLAEKLHYDYNYLSRLFSDIEGTTIEKYFIAQRIEKVKELLVYDERSLSEIAWQMGYSSVAHLSNQFKKVTGLTPSHFRQIRAEKRKPLDEV